MLRLINLQRFAEGGDGGANGSSGDPGAKGGEPDVKGLDEVLKDKTLQSEFDKRVSKALETARTKWESEAQKKIEDATAEAQKLAKMNADQKAEYDRQKRDGELAQREKALTARELKAQAYEILAEKSLPRELSDLLNFESAEMCNAGIASVEKAFQVAVEKAVNDRLRGNPPKSGDGGGDKEDARLRKAFGL